MYILVQTERGGGDREADRQRERKGEKQASKWTDRDRKRLKMTDRCTDREKPAAFLTLSSLVIFSKVSRPSMLTAELNSPLVEDSSSSWDRV